jgi:hypothetical protein
VKVEAMLFVALFRVTQSFVFSKVNAVEMMTELVAA